MNRSNPAQTYIQEAEDLLGKIEEVALEVTPGAPPGEPVHELFRAFHTIKGSGAMFGFDAVAAFTHHVETVLDKVRDGVIPVTNELIDLILASKDQIKILLECAQTGSNEPTDKGDKLIAGLTALLQNNAASAVTAPSNGQTPAAESILKSLNQNYRIQFRPHAGIFLSGTNPLMLVEELRALGPCIVTAKTDAVPPLEQLKSDQCYLAWEIRLTTDKGLNAIKDVFIFVDDVSDLKIDIVSESVAKEADLSASSGKNEGNEIDLANIHPETAIPTSPELLNKPIEEEFAHKTKNSVSSSKTVLNEHRKVSSRDSVVRVPSERLDRLVNLVGELVMNQSRLTQVASSTNVPNLTGPVEELERLVSELRDNVLGIRMMPIGTTFSRFKRLVHDLSQELGKEIDLVTEGAETELDKTVLDQLGDPLVHIIRNSIDHGIEQPAERERDRGQPADRDERRAAERGAAWHAGGAADERERADDVRGDVGLPRGVLGRQLVWAAWG